MSLLLQVLPIVAKESCFALHGGTAINLFVRNMPRLSVDIDLTYLPIESRELSIRAINQALVRIKVKIERLLSTITVSHLQKEAKLLVTNHQAVIKIEVNLIKRGCFSPPVFMQLCENAQKDFGVFCEMSVVNEAHLFGGKICAALDRQHPRDLFDVQYILDNQRFNEELKKGFIFYLISSNRPIAELLYPNFSDQLSAFSNQFSGMTSSSFLYQDFETTRVKLLKEIHSSLNQTDREFLYQLESGYPNWDVYDFSVFPSVQWKLVNIAKLKLENPAKHASLLMRLK